MHQIYENEREFANKTLSVSFDNIIKGNSLHIHLKIIRNI